MNNRGKSMVVFAVVALFLVYMFCNQKSKYTIGEPQYALIDVSNANGGLSNANKKKKNRVPRCAANSGTGLASSLLPREIASQEDFGKFAPEKILKGQNFLDPRGQIGIPETIGGTLRNANQQVRAEPPNPKQPYVWNNSTIVPDLMQRRICT